MSFRNGETERDEDDISIAFRGGGLERIEELELDISESDRFRFSSIPGS